MAERRLINKNFKCVIVMDNESPRRYRYIGVQQIVKYFPERSQFLYKKMQNLEVDKRKFSIQNKGALYVYLV